MAHAASDPPRDSGMPGTLLDDGRSVLEVADAIDAWVRGPDGATRARVSGALATLVGDAGVTGGRILLSVPSWPDLDASLGAPHDDAGPPGEDVHPWSPLSVADGVALGVVALEGDPAARALALSRLRVALELAWARSEARIAGARLDALDTATAAIAAELSVDRVLQVIVDHVRRLVSARYAALGILGEHGRLDRFITSGIDASVRRAIGHPPHGHGILGLIIRQATSMRLPDLMDDPRAHGFPPGHPPMHAFLGVPVSVEGRPIGNLYLTDKQAGAEFTDDDQRLVETFARHAGIAIHNARLHTDLQRLAVLQERERIGQDLHDGIIQALYAVGLSLEDVGELMTDDPPEAEARVERAIDSIHGAIRDIRNFIFALRPGLLEDVDLRGGLANLADEFRRSTLVDVSLTGDGPADLDAEDAVQVLQIAREALSNVARHAQATRVGVELTVAQGILRLVIDDDGHGFDPSVSRGPAHHGLGNMRARAESLGGTLTLDSRPSGGTRVAFSVPLDPDARTEETPP